jgi:sugar/nucleoside kinase (ribokinase family)
VNFKAIAGGSPFNVAVGLRRLGVDAALFAGLSTDYLGRRLLQVLQDEGVAPTIWWISRRQPPWPWSRSGPMARRTTASVVKAAPTAN